MTSVFLSYAHRDEARVRPIALALTNAKHEVFWDRDLRAGDSWPKVLHSKVLGAQCVVVAWTMESLESQYVLLEARLAMDNGRFLPVLLDDVVLPERFADIHAIDLRGWIGNIRHPEWSKLVAAIEEAGRRAVEPATDDGAPFRHVPSNAPKDVRHRTREDRRAPVMGIDLERLVESQVRAALDLSPVQVDALRDITSIRVRSDSEFSDKVHELEKYGYELVRNEAGEALLERPRRFNWRLATILTFVFVFPVLFYLLAFPFLPRVHRVWVVRVA